MGNSRMSCFLTHDSWGIYIYCLCSISALSVLYISLVTAAVELRVLFSREIITTCFDVNFFTTEWTSMPLMMMIMSAMKLSDRDYKSNARWNAISCQWRSRSPVLDYRHSPVSSPLAPPCRFHPSSAWVTTVAFVDADSARRCFRR